MPSVSSHSYRFNADEYFFSSNANITDVWPDGLRGRLASMRYRLKSSILPTIWSNTIVSIYRAGVMTILVLYGSEVYNTLLSV